LNHQPATPSGALACCLMLAGVSFLAACVTAFVIEITRSWLAGGVATASCDSRWLPVFTYAAWNTAIVYWIARRGERYV
jgi:hypothetical protein